jgi:hypothetical protein
VAIKLGDVNNSWTTGTGGGGGGPTENGGGGPAFNSPQVAKPIVTFTVSNASGLPGTSVVVRVTATGFSRVTSVQGTIEWDPHVIQFAATEQFGVTGFSASSFGTALVTNGTISFSWDDPASSGVSVADGSVVFALRFNVIGASGAASRVAVNDAITVREVGVDFTPAIFQTVDGQLSVASTNVTQVSYQALANGAPGVSVPTVSGKTYILEYTDFVPSTNWTALPGVPGDGTTKLLNDPGPASPQRFYRVRIQ